MTGPLGDPLLLSVAVVLTFALAWTLWRCYSILPSQECDAAAEDRASVLLGELLSGDEKSQLVQHGYLTVTSPGVSGRIYRIPVRPGWVDVYESEKLAMRLCVEPVERLPASDVVIMHKLMIEGNEGKYLREANVVYIRPASLSRRRVSL